MSLVDRIESDFLTAYKGKQTDKTAALRMLKAALKNLQVELGRLPDDLEILSLIRKQCKQRRESIEQFERGGRQAMADQERRELEILAAYLPPPLTSAELKDLVNQAVDELQASTTADMGRVMQTVLDRAHGRADGRTVSAVVRARLGS